MNVTSATRTVATLAAVVALGSALQACGAEAAPQRGIDTGISERVIERDVKRLEMQAEQYAGDPWETRYRTQFWAGQHIHDSWNRCHLGENAPRPRGC